MAWPGSSGRAGWMTRATSGRAFEPARERQRLALGFAKPQLHRAQAAQREKHILGTGRNRHLIDGLGEPRKPLRIGGDEAEQQIGMAGEILGARLHRHVDAVRVRRKEQRRRPGVVGDDAGAARVRGCGDRRDVLHLQRLRARRFDEHRLGVGAHQRGDPRADERIVIGGLDAHALQRRCRRRCAPAGRPSRSSAR